ncbi:hypothetical protein [Streptomyces apricus]|uniref:hypothetical protein n=1 Tax=Streptomyces apricus TaxID=1828112 RepID=UPI001F250C31|nr:hypothetical protein [Streptomyces apricus]
MFVGSSAGGAPFVAVARDDAEAEAVDESEASGAALPSVDADADPEVDGEGDPDGEPDPDGDGSATDASGTLARRSSGVALPRDGDSYENSPLANPAAATTTAVAPAPTRTKRRRRLPFPPSSSLSLSLSLSGKSVGPDGEAERWAGIEGAATAGIGTVEPSAPGSCVPPPVPDPSGCTARST